ncbi:hypothetical protein [Streptomyces sp. NPDC002889]|uniref:hypothetical protein n=1 Tax=Streptomyces sp. NPDC002889 TaxID=3364669 RepID=UPI0036B46199
MHLGRLTEAAEVHEREIALFRARGDRHKEAEAPERLATTLRYGRRRLQAAEAYVRAVGIYHELEDTSCERRTLSDLGLPVRDTPRADKAMALYTWVLANLPENDGLDQKSRILIALAVAQQRAGRITAALWSWASLTRITRRLLDEGNDQAPEQYFGGLKHLMKARLHLLRPFPTLITLRDRHRRPTT